MLDSISVVYVIVFMVRMHQMRVTEMVELIRVGRCKCAVNLENGNAENEHERKYVEKDSQFDDDSVFKENSGSEQRYAVLEYKEPQNLSDCLFA